MPSLGRMLKETLAAGYDYLQLVVVANVLWCTAWIAPALAAAAVAASPVALAALGATVGALTVGPATLGLAHLSHHIATRDDPGLRHFFQGYSRFFWRGVFYFLINAVIVAGCILNIGFYTTKFAGHWLWMIGVLWIYVLIFWCLMQLYAPQFIVREDSGVWRGLRKAALLAADSIGYSTVVMLEIAAMAALLALPVLLGRPTLMGLSVMVVFFLFAGLVALLGAGAVEDLLRKYQTEEGEATEPPEDLSPEEEAFRA